MKINASGLTSKFLSRMFRRINGVVWDLSTGNIGLQDTNGIYTLTKNVTPASGTGADAVAATTEFGISVNPFDNFGMAIPAFATQVPFDKIEISDIVVGDKGILGWVVGKTAAQLKLLDFNGMNKTYSPPKVAIGGSEGVLVVQSLGGLAGGSAGLGGLQGALMPLLMLGGDTDGLEDILPLILFQQAQGGEAAGAGLASMMPMLMMSKLGKGGSGGFKDMLPMLLMSGGLGGAGGAGGLNPMLMMALLGDKDDSPLPLTALNRSVPPLRNLRNSNGV